MKIEYPNSQQEFESYLRWRWQPSRARMRSSYYENTFWHSATLLLGMYASYLAESPFLIALFVVLACIYCKQNWSFGRKWQAQIQTGVMENFVKSQNALLLEEQGLTETYNGITVAIPWPALNDYTSFGGCLLIQYLTNRSIIVPESALNVQTRQELLDALNQHGVHEKPATKR